MTREPKFITSLTNDRVKAIRALDMRKERKETGLFVAEGPAILITAREHGYLPETVVFQHGANAGGPVRDLVEAALDAGREVLAVSAQVLEKLASKENPQAIVGVFRQTWATPSAARGIGKDGLWLALEEIRDPGNLGTIIRTADAVGAAGIILVGTCCDPFARDAVRATMGSIFAVPIARMPRDEFLAWRADWPGDVVGTHLDSRQDFRNAVPKEPVMLVMGSEGPGLSESLTRTCTQLVKIPMAGQLDSLNLAVATALTLYQLRGKHLSI